MSGAMISGGGIVPSGITRLVRSAAIQVAIPAISTGQLATVPISVPGLQLGDTVKIALTSDSAAMPANVFEAPPHAVTVAGTLALRFANFSTLLGSTATTIKITVTYWGP